MRSNQRERKDKYRAEWISKVEDAEDRVCSDFEASQKLPPLLGASRRQVHFGRLCRRELVRAGVIFPRDDERDATVWIAEKLQRSKRMS